MKNDLRLYTIMPLDTDHIDEVCDDIKGQYYSGVANYPLFSMTLVPEGDPPADKVGKFCATVLIQTPYVPLTRIFVSTCAMQLQAHFTGTIIEGAKNGGALCLDGKADQIISDGEMKKPFRTLYLWHPTEAARLSASPKTAKR